MLLLPIFAVCTKPSVDCPVVVIDCPGRIFSNSIKLMLERQKFALCQQEMLLQWKKITLYQQDMLQGRQKPTLYQHAFMHRLIVSF